MTAAEFRAHPGVEDWEVVDGMACARFATGSFAAGVRLVTLLAARAEEAGHHPDVDLRYPDVTVRLVTHDAGGLTRKDVDLAREISDVARVEGIDVVA